MRILRLDLGSGKSLDLHPFVTILPELDEADRDELLESIRTLARGSTAGIRGLVQNQGLLLELDGQGHDRLAALTGADVVIDSAGQGFDVPWLQAQVDQQQRRAEISAVIVEEIRADIDASARARVAALEERLAPADDEQAKRSLARFEKVSSALEGVDRLARMVVDAPPGVRELQGAFSDNTGRLLEAERHFNQLAGEIDRAENEVGEARAALKKAQDEAKPLLLTREEEARLEVLSFPATDETRRGRWRKNLRSEEQKEKEALLRKVGVESHTAYTVYRASPTVSQDRIDAAAAGQAGVADAETNLAAAKRAQRNDQLYRELTAETEALREQARGFLGMMLPADVAQGLGSLTIERENPDWHAAAAQVGSVLADLHIDETETEPSAPSGGAEGEAAVERAREWLKAQAGDTGVSSVDALRRELDRERGALDRHQRALSRISRAEATAVDTVLGLARLEEQLAATSLEPTDTVEGLLALIEPIATQVTLEAQGSLPIALVGEFKGLIDGELPDLMSRLGDCSERLQVLVLTNRSAAADWVGGVGLDLAMVSRSKVAIEDGWSIGAGADRP